MNNLSEIYPGETFRLWGLPEQKVAFRASLVLGRLTISAELLLNNPGCAWIRRLLSTWVVSSPSAGGFQTQVGTEYALGDR